MHHALPRRGPRLPRYLAARGRRVRDRPEPHGGREVPRVEEVHQCLGVHRRPEPERRWVRHLRRRRLRPERERGVLRGRQPRTSSTASVPSRRRPSGPGRRPSSRTASSGTRRRTITARPYYSVAREPVAAFGVWGAGAADVYAHYSNTIFRRDPAGGTWSAVYTVDDLEAARRTRLLPRRLGNRPGRHLVRRRSRPCRHDARGATAARSSFARRRTAGSASPTASSATRSPLRAASARARCASAMRFGGWFTDIQPVSATEYVALHNGRPTSSQRRTSTSRDSELRTRRTRRRLRSSSRWSRSSSPRKRQRASQDHELALERRRRDLVHLMGARPPWNGRRHVFGVHALA